MVVNQVLLLLLKPQPYVPAKTFATNCSHFPAGSTSRFVCDSVQRPANFVAWLLRLRTHIIGWPRCGLCICKNPASRRACWSLQRRCSMAPGPERLIFRLVHHPQAHLLKAHVLRGFPAHVTPNDAQRHERNDAVVFPPRSNDKLC